jgi:hypothetical protein
VTVNVWRTSSTSLIRPKFTWQGRVGLTGATGECDGASSIGSGRSGGGGRSWCGGNGARVAPFIGAREGGGMEGTASADDLAIMAGMEQTTIGTARAQWRGGR